MLAPKRTVGEVHAATRDLTVCGFACQNFIDPIGFSLFAALRLILWPHATRSGCTIAVRLSN